MFWKDEAHHQQLGPNINRPVQSQKRARNRIFRI